MPPTLTNDDEADEEELDYDPGHKILAAVESHGVLGLACYSEYRNTIDVDEVALSVCEIDAVITDLRTTSSRRWCSCLTASARTKRCATC